MPKYYKKRSYRASKEKYSVEQTLVNGTIPTGQTTSVDVVPAVALQGMRKVKHITITLSPFPDVSMLWALFYLPAGMAVPAFNSVSGGPLIEPNQYVMNCGVFDSDAGPQRISSPVSRNLNSGDRIILLLLPVGASATGPYSISALVRYAITLN